MEPKALERQWLHVHIIDGDVYVFTDDGHWKDTLCQGGKDDWDRARELRVEDLAKECCVGTLNANEFFVRIQLNPIPPKIVYGKFGMPYEMPR